MKKNKTEIKTISLALDAKIVKKLRKLANEKYLGNLTELMRELIKPVLKD